MSAASSCRKAEGKKNDNKKKEQKNKVKTCWYL